MSALTASSVTTEGRRGGFAAAGLRAFGSGLRGLLPLGSVAPVAPLGSGAARLDLHPDGSLLASSAGGPGAEPGAAEPRARAARPEPSVAEPSVAEPSSRGVL